jgi:hypothetical protein
MSNWLSERIDHMERMLAIYKVTRTAYPPGLFQVTSRGTIVDPRTLIDSEWTNSERAAYAKQFLEPSAELI